MRMLNAIFPNSGSYTDKTTNWRIVVFYTIFFIYTINCLNSSSSTTSSCMDKKQQQQQEQNNATTTVNHCAEEVVDEMVKFGGESKRAASIKEREMLLIRKQRELHNQLKDLYMRQKKLKSERDALHNDDSSSSSSSSSSSTSSLMPPNIEMDFEFEIPSYCSNCLGDIMQPPYKSSLSSEYSRENSGDDEMINLQDDINVPQLSDHSRLESIKHQILLKLGMKHKPNITESLPKQFIYDTLRRSGEPEINDFLYHFKSMSTAAIHNNDNQNDIESNASEAANNNVSSSNVDFQSDGETDFDDFYGKPREIITFAELGHTLNGHHLLEFPSPVDSQSSAEGSKLKIHKATLFIKIEENPTLNNKLKEDNEEDDDDDISQLHSLSERHHRSNHHEDESSVAAARRSRKKRIRKDDDITNDSRYIFSFKNNRNHIKTNENNDNHINNNEIERKRKLRKAINVDNTNIKLNSEQNNNNLIKSTRNVNVTLWIFRPKKPVHNVQLMNETVFHDLFELSKSQVVHYQNNDGWQSIDVTSLVQKWYSNDNKDKQLLRIFVDCSGCRDQQIVVHPFVMTPSIMQEQAKSKSKNDDNNQKQRENREKVENVKPNRPYLAVHIEPTTLKRYKRRALDCSVATKSQCCKQRFYVSFKALGWDDWIIAPAGYYANYCSGTCGNGLNRSPDMFPTYYSHVVHQVRKYNKLNGNQLCCAPLKYSSMSLIYLGPDEKLIKRDLPKMVVDECGCP